MKKNIVVLFAVALCMSCMNKAKDEVKIGEYASFVAKISQNSVLSKQEMSSKYSAMKQGDTVAVKFKSKINNVCQKKGCWMNLDLANNENAFVKFKDYAFFMPLNSKDNEAIVRGKAFISVETLAELKHYAKDAGKSQAAIDSITEPKKSFGFMADGVLLKK